MGGGTERNSQRMRPLSQSPGGSRRRGAPWITCLPAPGQAVLGKSGMGPPPRGGAWSGGGGAGRGGGCGARSRGPLKANNSRPCYPGDGRRGGPLVGWGRGAVRTLGKANEKIRPGPRGRCRRSHAHLGRAVAEAAAGALRAHGKELGRAGAGLGR